MRVILLISCFLTFNEQASISNVLTLLRYYVTTFGLDVVSTF